MEIFWRERRLVSGERFLGIFCWGKKPGDFFGERLFRFFWGKKPARIFVFSKVFQGYFWIVLGGRRITPATTHSIFKVVQGFF